MSSNGIKPILIADVQSVLKELLKMPQNKQYTCTDYREEMRLVGLKKRLNEENLSRAEKQNIKKEISKLEEVLQLD